ncbi:MAG: rod shape-determining protein MreD [Nitrospirota bacterium]
MNYLLWTAVILFTIVLQGSFSLFDITPNFTVIIAYYAGIKKGRFPGLAVGSLIGLIQDFLSGAFLGPNFLGKGLVGYLSSSVYNGFFIWTRLLGVISMLVLTATDSLIIFLSKSVFNVMPASFGTAALIIAVQSLVNAPLGAVIRPDEQAR